MKKLFLMVAIAFTTLSMNAQEESKITVKAGVGMSSVVGDDVETDAVVSYKVGATYDFALSENFSIIPGLEFATKGWKEDAIDGNISVSYLQLPVLAAYKFNLSDNMKLVVKAGPYVAYGIFGSDIEWYGGGSSNVFDICERFDAGAVAGASIEFGKYSIGLEYSRGLTKVVSDVKSYNQAYGLTLGYKF
jgi:hypothetical protein